MVHHVSVIPVSLLATSVDHTKLMLKTAYLSGHLIVPLCKMVVLLYHQAPLIAKILNDSVLPSKLIIQLIQLVLHLFHLLIHHLHQPTLSNITNHLIPFTVKSLYSLRSRVYSCYLLALLELHLMGVKPWVIVMSSCIWALMPHQ
jgi:hypothetical protein